MKRGTIAALSLLVLLTACGQRSTEPPKDESSSIQPAVLEGEALSPDGRFRAEVEGVSEGLTAMGLYPAEFVQIVDAETGDVLWQEMGAYAQEILWSPEGQYAAVARSTRTHETVFLIETQNWTAWEFTLPDGEPIPEYTFLPDNWGVWQDENCLNLTVGGTGDGEEAHFYSCSLDLENGTLTGRSWETTKEILSETYDFNHDGKPETLELTTIWFPGMTGAAVDTYILSILDKTGEIIWQDTAGTSHAGENSLYACQIDGASYLLRYQPYMQHGICTYRYELFSLDEAGQEVPFQENSVKFSANGSKWNSVGLNPAEVAGFLKEVHQYLDASELLVSTVTADDLFFLDYDNTLTLEENLQRHKDSIEQY
ncbi:MAG: hypothetical protein HFF86_11310 [Oscillibacter sp.]|nr:hypothetical protein [Oscillibacter sp.]